MKQRIKISKEAIYFIAILILSFAVAMISSTGFGLSMIVSPAYIISQKVSFLSFGQAEYVVQAVWLAAFCLLTKSFKLQYLFAFVTGLIYGFVLDMWRLFIPHFNPSITPPGSLPLALRIVYFVCGVLLTSFSIALFYKSYLYPQVYDFFVKYISAHFKLSQTKFKVFYDCFNLAVACVLTLVLFKKFVGVGIGTVIMALLNGFIIGFFTNFFDKHFIFYSHFSRLEAFFDI